MSEVTVLPIKTTIYLPSRYGKKKGGGLIPYGTRVALESAACNEILRSGVGGCTVTDGMGYWRDGEGEVVSESVTLVTFFLTEEQDHVVDPSGLYQVLRQYHQDVISVETNGVLHLIPVGDDDDAS